MTDESSLNLLFARVERLLVRHDELIRTNAILHQQVTSLMQERDSLKTRMMAARARVDTLLGRLPTEGGTGEARIEEMP